MAALKFEEAQLNVTKDIDLITKWSEKFDSFASRQAQFQLTVTCPQKESNSPCTPSQLAAFRRETSM